MNYKFHPLADVLPLIEGAEFDRLVADISERPAQPHHAPRGHDPRRPQPLSCLPPAGIDPIYVPFTGKDPVAFVLSQNLARRHLGPSERAMVAARLATLGDGQRQVGKFAYVPTQEQAAQLAGVSERSVKSARVVLESGTPELRDAVTAGRLAVHEAEKAARLPVDAQQEFLDAAATGKTFHSWRNNFTRKERAIELAAAARALPHDEKRWPIILADPPWDFHAWNPDSSNTHAAQHYPVMSLAEICALPVSEIACSDCVLFFWTTAPYLGQSFDVLSAWGFEYKSGLVWDKEAVGTGYWIRGQHEHLLICTRGNPPLPPMESVPASVIRERRREHSRKPEQSYAIIERMYPGLPKLELFARQARPGWDAWGNETGKFAEVGEPAPLTAIDVENCQAKAGR